MFQFKIIGRKEPIRQSKTTRRAEFPSYCGRVNRFALFMLSTNWMSPTHIREGNLFYSVYWYWFKCSYHPETSHRYPQNNAWPNVWAYCCQSSWYIDLTITSPPLSIWKPYTHWTIVNLQGKAITRFHNFQVFVIQLNTLELSHLQSKRH